MQNIELLTTVDDIIKDYEKGEDIIFYTKEDGTDAAIPESVIEELLQKFDKRNTKAEGVLMRNGQTNVYA